MKINPLKLNSIKPDKYYFAKKQSFFARNFDIVNFKSNPNIDSSFLVSRKIITHDTDINDFLKNISDKIFKNENKQKEKFLKYLLSGKISLSSSCYDNLNHPQSAVALEIDPNNSIARILSLLNEYVNFNEGIGINFSNFDNPIDTIKNINSFFKYKQNNRNTKRPPAGIAILNINHPKIKEFIKLKDNKDYQNWCFDLSVVIDDSFFKKLKQGDAETIEIYSILTKSMFKTGEPGVIFSNDKNYICDCCAASKLNTKEHLTLGQINLSKFITNNKIDYSDLKEASKILNIAMKKLDKNAYISILGYQDLLNKLNLDYSKSGEIIEKCIKTIQSAGAKVALSPTGTTSKILKTTPSINPSTSISYKDEIKIAGIAQKQIDKDEGGGQISKTIILKNNMTQKNVSDIIKLAYNSGLKGICVFKP